jgi:DNA repair protein RecN (Recombination protein N)
MLSLIRVKNYAVIDEVELEFAPGFSVMTGETGAGKSILVDALGLALGDRADANTVRHGADRAEISVVFDCPSEHASITWLREHGLDDGNSCTLRRVVTTEGRSRAFINNQPVTLQDLKTLGGLLIDIHGQHAHQSLLDTANQRALLDAHGGLDELAAQVARTFSAWKDLASQLDTRRAAGTDRAAQLELLRFQAAELETLALAAGEPEQLRIERDRLANTDRLLGGISAALAGLYESEMGSAYSLVVRAEQELTNLVDHDPELHEPTERLAGVQIELRELSSSLNHYRDRIEADPERLDWLDNRLAKIRTLARRHGVPEAELPPMLGTLQQRIDELDGGQESLEALAERVERAEHSYFEVARNLSRARAKQGTILSQQVSEQLTELGMPHGQFQVELQGKAPERADGTGMERVEFQVKLNPGQPFGALNRMASGGELSRISLAIEVVRSGASPVPAFVFDEVDAGVGGRVAEIVGRRLSQLAESRQVLCVTHLPQVASQGQRHYRVVKLTDGKTSRTNVRSLSVEERVEELSRMLGGIEITERTRAHAAEMIDRAAKL